MLTQAKDLICDSKAVQGTKVNVSKEGQVP